VIPSLSELKPHLLNPDLSEADCLKAIRSLSSGFTHSRDKMGNYGDDPDLVSAYTQLYLPTNWPKLEFVLSQLSQQTKQNLTDAHFIDFGCGPGTYSLAWCDSIKTKSVTLVDRAHGMLDQANKLMEHFYPEVPASVYRMTPPRPEGKVVLFFGHSINEIGIAATLDVIRRIDPDFVFFIEPGTSEFFKQALTLRTSLVEQGMSIAYPCPSLAKCPNDWCHQVWRGSHDLEVERLCQKAQIDRRSQAMTAHLYSKENFKDDRSTLTRFLTETKFSFDWEICDGSEKLHKVQLPKKQFTKSEAKEMQKQNVGIRFRYEVEKVLGDGILRAKLLK
tara:strand:- start:243 stop:1241 length:999 start_codon:yes stop_codon:yes gene_type:complete